jgi:hypothetical protein
MSVTKNEGTSHRKMATRKKPTGEPVPGFETDIRLITSFESGNSPKAKAKAQAYFLKERERIDRERLYGPDPSWMRRLLRRLTVIR